MLSLVSCDKQKTARVCFLSGNITLMVFLAGKPTIGPDFATLHHVLNEPIERMYISSNFRLKKNFVYEMFYLQMCLLDMLTMAE
jgi:hypothetical protein